MPSAAGLYSYDELVQLARQAGFSGQSAGTMAAIAMAESGGNPNAVNYGDPGGSYGLTQINAAAHGAGALNALDPLNAFQQAFSISNGGTNFTPWSTFNSGAFLGFLGGSGGSGTGGPGGSSNASSGLAGSTTGQSATGQTVQSQSPLSAIFQSVGNLFQSFGLLLLGAVLVLVGAWYLAKPHDG